MKLLIISCLGFMTLGSQFVSANQQEYPCLFGEDREAITSDRYADLERLSFNPNPEEQGMKALEKKVLTHHEPSLDFYPEGGIITFRAKQNGRTYVALDWVDNGYLDIYDAETLEMVGQTDHGTMDVCKVPFKDTESLPFFYKMGEKNDDYYGDSPIGGNLLDLARMKRFDFSPVKIVTKPSILEKLTRHHHYYTFTDRVLDESFMMILNFNHEKKLMGGRINLLTPGFVATAADIDEKGNLPYIAVTERRD